jgi:hypothetical protein
MFPSRSARTHRIRPQKTDTLHLARQIGRAGYSSPLLSVVGWYVLYQLAT